jgi:deoxyuridine 5'-triphosphate nucleotidohydrolase
VTPTDAYELGRVAAVETIARADFPALTSDDLRWDFVRGCFDTAGRIAPPESGRLDCAMTIAAEPLRAWIRRFVPIPCEESGSELRWTGGGALDLLAKLCDGATACAESTRDAYRAWAAWVPGLSPAPTGVRPRFRWARTDSRAVAPSKQRASDSGFDLTLIRRAGEHGPVTLFGTGIRVEPEHGWYFDVVPRSSIIKTGHMLANCVGVIDRTYRGEILVPLAKLRADVPDLELPCRVVQMIPRPIIHPELCEVADLDATARGEGGFGSTG